MEIILSNSEQEKTIETPPAMHFIRQRTIFLNMVIMALIWLTSGFDYFLIMFLVNTFSRVYVTAVASSVSELIAYPVSGVIYSYFGAKKTLAASFSLSFVGGILILLFGLRNEDSWIFVVLVIFAKFGIACTQSIVYVAHPDIFPPLFAASALGYCSFLAHLFSSLSSLISTMEEPEPIIIFTCTTGFAALLSLCLRGVIKSSHSD